MKTALLVIDLQRYFLEVGCEEKLARVGTLIAKTNELIDLFHEQDLPVVKIQIVHKTDGSTWNQGMKPHGTGQPIKGTLTEGTREAEPHPDVHVRPTDIVVTKTRGSAFIRTELEAVLTKLQVDTVVLTGFSTNRCGTYGHRRLGKGLQSHPGGRGGSGNRSCRWRVDAQLSAQGLCHRDDVERRG